MNAELSIPPLRDLPPDRLAQRSEHLLFEITHERESRGALVRLRPSSQGNRRRLIALAAAALVVVLGTASALAVRALFEQGIVGVAPEGAVPSTPERGELVLGFMFGHTEGDPGRFTVYVYADGRMIWQRLGDYYRPDSTGFLEQRLTPEGVELVRAEVLSTGLVEHDLRFLGGRGEDGLYSGGIDFRTGDRRVHVTWGDDCCPYPVYPEKFSDAATPEQASALVRLDARLADPASWLPASAWEDREIRAYVPSGYDVCYEGAKGVGRDSVLALLPPRAAGFLSGKESRPNNYTNGIGTFVVWCSDLTNEEARSLERILDDAGWEGRRDVFGLTYGSFDVAASGNPEEFSLQFAPLLPDSERGTK